MESQLENVSLLLVALSLVLINGLFVAAEFALVKVSAAKIDSFVAQKRPFSKIVRSQLRKLDAALSACQLGITLASLGLGWVGEPALARMIRPVLHAVGIESTVVLHTIAFTFAFGVITALHLTIGEQVPKMYAIRFPERVTLWCALPLKIFYVAAYPFLIALNATSNFLLRRVGASGTDEHGEIHSEDEIRALLAQAHTHGELSRTEHRLLDAVFEFDDRIVREIMIPKRDIIFLEEGKSFNEYLQVMSATKHTRYPFCRTSLDNVLGVVHIKDLIGMGIEGEFDITSILRPPQKVPEGVSIGKLMRQFQSTKQHMAFVVDEFGNTIGVITMENILEEIVGAVQDEFDIENAKIVPEENGKYLIDGGISLAQLSKQLKIVVADSQAETLSGLITEYLERLPTVGDKVQFDEMTAEVVHTHDGCAEQVRVVVIEQK